MTRVLHVEFIDTLMRYDYALEFHVQSGDRSSWFYIRVPDSWATLSPSELTSRVYAVAQTMYSDLNARFQQAEPDDLGYLMVKETRPAVLTPDEEQSAPWSTAPEPAVWEWTPCVVVDEDGTYTKVARDAF